MSVHKILTKNKFYLFIIHLVQELSEDDFDRWILRIDEEPNFPFNSFFG